MRDAVQLSVCVALIRSELSGYEGYPHTEAGENRFARALQDVAVSVAHATAILSRFTGKFPTVQDISDTGISLLQNFQIQHSQLLEWEREYGRPQPIKADFTPASEQTFVKMDREAIQHLTLKHGGKFPGFAKISWSELFEAYETLGYELNSEQKRMMGRG